MLDKSRILTRAKLKKLDTDSLFLDSFMRNFGGNPQKVFEGVEDTVLEYGETSEFEFDGFSLVVEDGVFAVQFEDPEEGLVIQNLVDEGENEPKFPYLFEAAGVEKALSEEDYLRAKRFLEKKRG
jgi:hypothetical protein